MRRTDRWGGFGVTGLLMATMVVVLGTAAPAAAASCVGGTPSDFNGDGIADAVIADNADFGVRVLYGTRTGLTTAGTQLLPIGASTDNDLRLTLATGDFNGDGCADLAVGDEEAPTDGHPFGGNVHIMYGSPAGLIGDSVLTARAVTGVTVADYDRFGAALTTGDFNHDGYADLAVGASGHSDYRGEVFVFPGSRQLVPGASGTGRRFTEGDGTIPGGAESGDKFGTALAAGDFDHDGTVDLAVGAPGENGYGVVFVVRGSGTPALLTSVRANYWSQDTAGIRGTPTQGDGFGSALAAGSFRGNTLTDLAVGVPFEGVDGMVSAGAVNIILNGGAGLTVTGNELWTGSSAHAFYGTALAAGDFTGDRKDDLAVGAPSDTVGGVFGAGSVTVLPGTAGGLGAGQIWTQESPGVPGTAEYLDMFGQSLVALRTTSSTHDDLLIGVPNEETPANSDFEYSGEVEFLRGAPAGLTTTGVQVFDDNSPGLPGPLGGIGSFGLNVA